MKKLYIILVALAMASCGNSEKNTNDEVKHQDANLIVLTKTQFESEEMQLDVLREQDFNNSIKVTGTIDVPPQNKANVSAFLGGYIKRTPLLIGDRVKKGQLLVTLENTEFIELQQEYAEISEQLHYLKAEYDRQKTLFDEKITSQKNYLKAESIYKSSLARYNGLQKKLRMININPTSVEQGNLSSQVNIYAPIAGNITKVNVSNGAFVSPADEILEIVDTHHLHLELAVFEKDIMKVKKGQPILFTIPEASDKTFKAEVYLVGTMINETSRSVKVHGHLEEDTNFVVGMFVEAEIITSTKKSMALPKEAVVEIGANFYALFLEQQGDNDYHFKKLKVNIGEQNEEFVEVLNSNEFNDKKVLVQGVFMLLDDGQVGGHDH